MRQTTRRLATGLLVCLLATDVAAAEPHHPPTVSLHQSAGPPAVAVDVGRAPSTGQFVAFINNSVRGKERHGDRLVVSVKNTGHTTSPAACVVSQVDRRGTSVWASSLETSPIPPGTTVRVAGEDPEGDSPRAIDVYRISCAPGQ
jgi:hypothetical protein